MLRDQTLARLIVLCCFLLAPISLTSCGNSTRNDEGYNVNDASTRTLSSELSQLLAPDCGVVIDGTAQTAVNRNQLVKEESLTAIGPNLVRVHRAGGDILIKLYGLSGDSPNSDTATAFLSQLSAGGAYLAFPVESCIIGDAAGTPIVVANLLTPGGRSFSEELIKAELSGTVDSATGCAEHLLSSCYSSLKNLSAQPEQQPESIQEEATNNTPSTDNESSSSNGNSTSKASAGEMREFLWKPKAESAYNKGSLVIHVDACNAIVFVDGEALEDYGPGNGRCNTSRAFKPGCAYGTNVKVEVFDIRTKRPYTHNGKPYVVVPNGCNRFEFN